MKHYMKKIAVCLLAVTVFSALAFTARASIIQTEFSVYTGAGSFKRIDGAREKQDSTPLFLEINKNYITPNYFARTMACDYDGTDAVNQTFLRGSKVDHVRCDAGIMYAIDSLIYERGGDWAVIEIQANGLSSTTTGWWAPDTDPDNGYQSPLV